MTLWAVPWKYALILTLAWAMQLARTHRPGQCSPTNLSRLKAPSDPTDLGHLSHEVLEHAMASLHAAQVALSEEQEERASDVPPPSEVSNIISAVMLLLCCVLCCAVLWSVIEVCVCGIGKDCPRSAGAHSGC